MTVSAPRPDPTARAKAPWPTAVSLAFLGALVVATAAFALHRPPRRAAVEAPAKGAAPVTLVRDVLTGRLLDAEGRPRPPTTGWGSPEMPIRLRFVPSTDQAQSGPSVERLVTFVRDRTGYRVEGAILRSYGLVIEEIASGQSEVAFLTATSYARAWNATANNSDPDDDIRAFLQVVRRGSPRYPGSDLSYRAALFVRDDSPIQDLEDITDDTVVALGGKTSGAGSLLPPRSSRGWASVRG